MKLLGSLAAALPGFAIIASRASAVSVRSNSNLPTLYIAGDSTAAANDGSPELLGWGEKIGQYLSIPVVNDAIAGATARSFTEDGNCTPFIF